MPRPPAFSITRLAAHPRAHKALVVLLIAGVLVGTLTVAGYSPPTAGIVALDVQPAQKHDLAYTGPLTDGSRFLVGVRGAEDPWAATIQFRGGKNGVEDPRLGLTNMVGELREGQESGLYPFVGLVMGDNDLEARTTRGSFYVQITYEEGRVPHIDEIRITPDGILVTAADPNEPSGDFVAQYEFNIIAEDGTVTYPARKQADPLLAFVPSTPGTYTVNARAQDSRGAWSVMLGKQFTVIGSLSTGFGDGAIREGASSITGPAVDQHGNAIFEAIKPGSGALGFAKRPVYGLVRWIGCPGPCDDPFTQGWLRHDWAKGLRDALIEVIA